MNDELAEVFPLCDFLREELKARGWTYHNLAFRTGLDEKVARGITEDPNRKLSKREARRLEIALGMSHHFFLRIQNTYLRSRGAQ